MTQRIVFRITENHIITLTSSSQPIETVTIPMELTADFLLEKTIEDGDGNYSMKRSTLFTLNSGDEITVEKIKELLVVVEQNQVAE